MSTHSLEAVLTQLGIDPPTRLPTRMGCPICHTPLAMEVVGTDWIYCHACHFIGDVIDLYAKSTKQDFQAGLAQLQQLGVAQAGPDLDKYAALKATTQVVMDIHNKGISYYRENASSLRAVLLHYCGQISEREALSLIPHVTLLRKDMFADQEWPKPVAQAINRLRGYTSVGFACWNRAQLVGWACFNVNDSFYLPILPQAGVVGGLLPSCTALATIATDSPEMAFRCLLRGARDSVGPNSVVSPTPGFEGTPNLPAREIIYWSPEGSAGWYRQAARHYGAKAVARQDLKKLLGQKGPSVDMGRFMREALNKAVPPLKVFGRILLDLPLMEARALVANQPLTPAEQATCMSGFPQVEASVLQELFNAAQPNNSVEHNGKTVVETSSGWVSGPTLVSDAVIRLQEIRVAGAGATVVGEVLYNRAAYPFEEPIDRVRGNTAKWLHSFVLQHSGGSCMIDPRWGRHLFDLAQRFHRPLPIMSSGTYGWDNRTLRMPCFTVDQDGVKPVTNRVDGPLMMVPDPLSVGELESFSDGGFCELFLAILHNLTAEPSGAVSLPICVERGDVMSGKIETLLGLLPYRAGTGPLPEVVRTISLRPDLLQAGNSLICPVDQRGLVGLKLVPGALLVGQVGLVDHAGMRVLFHVAPEVLKQEYRAETRFRDLAGCALKVLGRWGLQTNRLAPRGEWLDRQRGTGLASRVLELIQLGVRDGLIRPRQDGAGVVVTHTEFLSCLASWTPHPGLAALGQALSDGRYLVKTRPGAWVINQQVWDLAGSLYQTP